MKKGIIFLKLTIVLLGIIILALCTFLLPYLANQALVLNPEYAQLKYPVLLGIYLTTIPFFAALFQGIKLLNLIKLETGFSNSSLKALKNIERYAITIALIYLIGMIYLITENALHPGIALMGIIIMFTTFVIAVFAAVLKNLLRNVLELKFENDLTI